MAMGIFAMILLVLLGIVSNTGSTALSNIENLFDRIECPMPEGSGLWNNTGTIMRTNQTYNYQEVNNNVLTLTCTDVHTPDGFDYCYGCPTVSFAGMMFFIGDWISELVGNKLTAVFELFFFFVTPANFDILGYTINDISGIPLMIVIALYAMCYVIIGILAYKTISPFSGVS